MKQDFSPETTQGARYSHSFVPSLSPLRRRESLGSRLVQLIDYPGVHFDQQLHYFLLLLPLLVLQVAKARVQTLRRKGTLTCTSWCKVLVAYCLKHWAMDQKVQGSSPVEPGLCDYPDKHTCSQLFASVFCKVDRFPSPTTSKFA